MIDAHDSGLIIFGDAEVSMLTSCEALPLSCRNALEFANHRRPGSQTRLSGTLNLNMRAFHPWLATLLAMDAFIETVDRQDGALQTSLASFLQQQPAFPALEVVSLFVPYLANQQKLTLVVDDAGCTSAFADFAETGLPLTIVLAAIPAAGHPWLCERVSQLEHQSASDSEIEDSLNKIVMPDMRGCAARALIRCLCHKQA
jgi:hypothetical protein